MNNRTCYFQQIKNELLYNEWLDQLSCNASARMTPSYARIFRFFRSHSAYYGDSDVLRNLQDLHLVYRTTHHYKRCYSLTNRGRYLYKDGVFDDVPYWHIDPKSPRSILKNKMRVETLYHAKPLTDRIIFSLSIVAVIVGIIVTTGLTSPLSVGIPLCLMVIMVHGDTYDSHDNPLMYYPYQKTIHYIARVNQVPYLEDMLDRDIGLHVSEGLFMSHLISFNYFEDTHNLAHKDLYCSLRRWSNHNRWRVGSFHKMFNMNMK